MVILTSLTQSQQRILIVTRMMRKMIVTSVMNLMNQMKPPMMKMWRRMKLVMKILSISQEKKILEEITEQCAVTDLLINCFFYTPVLHTVRTKLVLLTSCYLNLTYF